MISWVIINYIAVKLCYVVVYLSGYAPPFSQTLRDRLDNIIVSFTVDIIMVGINSILETGMVFNDHVHSSC